MELTIVFNDGYIHTGRVNILGVGIVSSTSSFVEYLKETVTRSTNRWIEVDNGWIYNTNQIVKIKDCSESELRDININKILN